MGFYISRHLPSNNVYRLQIIFIEDIFVQILHVFRSGTYVNPFLFKQERVGQNSFLLDATTWKGSRHEEGKLPFHCPQPIV